VVSHNTSTTDMSTPSLHDALPICTIPKGPAGTGTARGVALPPGDAGRGERTQRDVPGGGAVCRQAKLWRSRAGEGGLPGAKGAAYDRDTGSRPSLRPADAGQEPRLHGRRGVVVGDGNWRQLRYFQPPECRPSE